MIRYLCSGGFLALLFILPLAPALAADDCLSCHQTKTPASVAQWQLSAHGGKVACSVCHGTDHELMVKGGAPVATAVCGKCHEKAFHDHVSSRHGMGLHSGWSCTRNLQDKNPNECGFCHEKGSTRPKDTVSCARFPKQSAEMRDIGCNRCHRVESSCAGCHTGHMTDLKIVRDPNSCAKCHMGPDHPQWEMWQTSLHGTLFANQGGKIAPDCLRCHMPQGSHNVSFGITATPGGVPFPAPTFESRRKEMEGVCNECHAPSFVRRELAAGDAVRKQSTALTQEADKIVWDLYDHGLLDPMPADRPPHPLSGKLLVTDGQLLYEETSHIERLLFKMKKYSWSQAVKGAYHQNPAYAHWYGNAELKMDLVDIRAEASRLQKAARPTTAATEDPARRIEQELLALKNKFQRGAIAAGDYESEKKKLLEQMK